MKKTTFTASMTTVFKTLVLSLGLFFAFASSEGAARSLTEIQATKTLIVGMPANIPPFQYKLSASASPIGYEVEVLRNVAKDLGVTLIIKEMPVVVDVLTALRNDTVDIAASSFALTSTRDKEFDLTKAHGCFGTSLLTIDPSIRTIEDMKGKRISVVKGSTFESYARKVFSADQIIVHDSPEESIRAFTSKAVDSGVGWHALTPFLSKVYKVNVQDTPILWSIPVGFLINPQSTGLQASLNRSLLGQKVSGKLKELNKRYFPNELAICK